MLSRYPSEEVPARAAELEQILYSIVPDLVSFIKRADVERASHQAQEEGTSALLQNPHTTRSQLEDELQDVLNITSKGLDIRDLADIVKAILDHSVNTSAPGFLDKLTSAPLAPGIAAECVLGVLNTNLHIYKISPVLTLIEKRVSKALATMFGLCQQRSGGISVQGGSAGNLTSIVVARNTLYPETMANGNSAVTGKLVLFASAHGHYSIEKAAQALGLGSGAVIPVPVDKAGCMDCIALEKLIRQALQQHQVPFYICATAGTTVLGAFDPFIQVAQVARKYGLWFHIDAAWGGGFVFANRKELRHKLRGTEFADSIATNPQKMLGVPITCSFLLSKDLRQVEQANTLKAGYLFHEDCSSTETDGVGDRGQGEGWMEPYDLADLTLQCGRRGDSLKLFLCWKFYGTQGYRNMIENAYDTATYLHDMVRNHQDLLPVLDDSKPSCLQVCFYYAPRRCLMYQIDVAANRKGVSSLIAQAETKECDKLRVGSLNSKVTARIARILISQGFMIDYAPALEGQAEKGSFFRVVVNISTVRGTVERLVQELVSAGKVVIDQTTSRFAGV